MKPELRSILRLRVPVIVILGSRDMPMGDVMSLGPGSIVELPKSAEAELELLVNNKPIGTGRAVKVGENFGIRISFIGDVKSRVQALGARPPAADPATAAASAPAAAAAPTPAAA